MKSVFGLDLANFFLVLMVGLETRLARCAAVDGGEHGINAIARLNGQWQTGNEAFRTVLNNPNPDKPVGYIGESKRRLAEDPTQLLPFGDEKIPITRVVQELLSRNYPNLAEQSQLSEGVVPTYPTWSDQPYRQALLDILDAAGIKILRLPNGSPVLLCEATALAYFANDQLNSNFKIGDRILVIDVGHGTLDVRIIVVKQSTVDPSNLSLIPDPKLAVGAELGGRVVDKMIVAAVREQCPTGIDDVVLETSARELKFAWSQGKLPNYVISWFDRQGGSHSKVIPFTQVMKDTLFAEYATKVSEEMATIRDTQVDHIVFGGGMTSLAEIRKVFTDMFPGAKAHQIPRPSGATATGAAIYGRQLIGLAKLRFDMSPQTPSDIVLFRGKAGSQIVWPAGTALDGPNTVITFEVDEEEYGTYRIAEAKPSNFLGESDSPLHFDVPVGTRFIRMTLGFAGTGIAVATNRQGPWIPRGVLSSIPRPGADATIREIQEVVTSVSESNQEGKV